MRKLNKKIAFATLGALVALAGSGVAYAFWTGTGSGTGSAATADGASNLTVTQTSTLAAMFPGDSPQAITASVANGGAAAVHVASVTVSIASVTPLAGQTCAASNYDLVNPVMGPAADIAPAGSAPVSGATIQFHNDLTANQDGCKGATVNLAYTVA